MITKKKKTTKKPAAPAKRTVVDVDSLFRLADVAWRDFDRRRSFEWKINLALWAALGLFAGLASSRGISLNELVLGYAMLVAVWFVYVFVWIRGIHCANSRDRETAQFYWSEIENTLSRESKKFGLDPDSDGDLPGFIQKAIRPLPAFIKHRSPFTQIAVTTLLILLALISMTL